MQENHFTIFNLLDEPKKYYGVTLLEMLTVSSIVLCGFAFDKLVIAILSACVAFKVVRNIREGGKFIVLKRWCFFFLNDLTSISKFSYRFYL